MNQINILSHAKCLRFCVHEPRRFLYHPGQDRRPKSFFIGPPHPSSRVRLIKFEKRDDETKWEEKYRIARLAYYVWDHKFWQEQNERFIKERKKYMTYLKDNDITKLTPEIMAPFYTDFMNKNMKEHSHYNYMWYKTNITLLFLEIGARLSRLFVNIFRYKRK